ncbi:o-succinylbenzoate synthase [bacterium]|nr:o-succinylbenzoate synthase [bacterium]
MKIDAVELRLLCMELRTPFETSFARETHKECLLVRVDGEGLQGWGEVVAMSEPLYNEETLVTCWHILEDVLIPATLSRDWESPDLWAEGMVRYRRNYMAKAGMEAALWDLWSQLRAQPLSRLWRGVRDRVDVGISLGVESDLGHLLPRIEDALQEGYRRVKLKIKPGWDVEVVAEVRRRYPELTLQVDANSAYGLEHLPTFQALDELQLLMIEQPLAYDDIVDHAQLQQCLRTPICLDESIDSLDQCRRALNLGSARVINIKPGRVGGFWAARAIHDHCQQRGIACWVGGMLETGVGRLQNLSLASLPNFTLAGDISASRRYFERDIIEPEVELGADGKVSVPTEFGVGSRLHWPSLERYTQRRQRYLPD